VIGKQGKGFKTAGDDGRKAEFKQDKSFRSDYGYKWEPKGEEATLWNGWKSHGLKPAYEPILMAMKPNEGSYANNALKYGVAGLNIDGGRIGINDNDPNRRTAEHLTYGKSNDTFLGALSSRRGDYHPQGRFPANVILDEEAGVMLDEQSGNCRSSGIFNRDLNAKNNWTPKGNGCSDKMYNDTGGASRFFYCAKASKSERDRGCERLEGKYNDDSRKDKNAIGCNNPNNRSGTAKQNHHPTVKPLALMKYLCTITKSPTGGIVLDPFCGSGTTLMACKETGRKYIGIEIDKEYFKIAQCRLGSDRSSFILNDIL